MAANRDPLVIIIGLAIFTFSYAYRQSIDVVLPSQNEALATSLEDPLGFNPIMLLNAALKDTQLVYRALEFSRWRVTWGPQGKTLIIGSSGTPDEDAQLSQFDLETGESTLLGAGSGPAVSHDGQFLAYETSDGSLRISRFIDEKLEFLVDVSRNPSGVPLFQSMNYAWSPNAQRLAYLRVLDATKEDTDTFARTTSAAIHIFDVLQEYDAQVYVSPAQSEISYASEIISGLSFAPDERIYFAQGRGGLTSGLDASLAYVDHGSDEAVVLADDLSNYTSLVQPISSPNGRYVAFGYSPDPDYFSYLMKYEKGVVDVVTGTYTFFEDGPFSFQRAKKWTSDGENVAYVCKPGAFANALCLGSVANGHVSLTILESSAQIGSFDLSPDGTRVAWISRDLTDTIRVKVGNLDGSDQRVILERSRLSLDEVALSTAQIVQWKSSDGLEFEGMLFLPLDYEDGKHVPLIVYVHGGPPGGASLDGSLLNTSPLEYQMWAAKGYAVFVADYRKGQIAGRDLRLLTRQPSEVAWWAPDARDVLAGVQHVIDLGIADPNRLGIIGHSAGSTLVNQLLTLDNPFAVAISKEGTSDMRMPELRAPDNSSKYLTMRFILGATDENIDQLMAQSSPVLFANNINSPLLLVTAGGGTSQYADMKQEISNAFVEAINQTGGVAEALPFPDDQHIIMQEKNVRMLLSTSIDWIDFWLMDYENPDPEKAEQYERWRRLRDNSEVAATVN